MEDNETTLVEATVTAQAGVEAEDAGRIAALRPQLVSRRPPDFQVSFVLLNRCDPEDIRQLTLKPDETCSIGRASRTKGGAYLPCSTNALFDCSVVSRQHAEIKVHTRSTAGDQITIVDHDSMHGTRVNIRKLENGRPVVLKNGDEIELGDKITRDGETCDSVKVTYYRLPSASSRILAPDTPHSPAPGVSRPTHALASKP